VLAEQPGSARRKPEQIWGFDTHIADGESLGEVQFLAPRPRLLGLACAVALCGVAPPTQAAKKAEEEPAPAFYDPRKRPLPRPHRFRLGLQIDYTRLSAAVNPDTGEEQRFFWLPAQLDFAYQAQFLKYFMARPSFAFGVNVGNTMASMPITLHGQIHAGYQGRLLGVAVGYGFFQPPIRNKDYVSTIRGGLGRPIIRNNHHIDGEVSLTSRVHRRREGAPGAGELSFLIRMGAVRTILEHFDVYRKSWRFMFTVNVGWYFGDGSRGRARKAKRRAPKPAGGLK